MDALVTPGSSRERASVPVAWRHAAHFGPLLLLCLAALVLGWARAQAGTPNILRLLYGLVVALNVLALGMSTWSTVLGFAVALASRLGFEPGGLVLRPPTGRARTAVLLPIHEEDAARVFAVARVTAVSVADQALGLLDIFVLSDSRSPGTVAAEVEMHGRVASPDGNGPRIFYRHRPDNNGRKAGNVADFIGRWGAAYDYMVVLDADSLLTGEAVARLIGAMEANPRAGLIQLMCYPVGRRSLFARLQQFNARLYGPLFQRGVAFWQGPRGNFWGHNAIVRIAAFAGSCGLPILQGRPPFGGAILSHDTVEAALLLRDGHEVWMLPDDPARGHVGSWEETPTNLIDHLERDRRWCRGNLQHIQVLGASGLKPASLYHLTRGLLHYLYAPLVVLWIVLYAALDRGPPGALFWLVAAMIVVPRALCLAVGLVDRALAKGFGGRPLLVAGALLDHLANALLYPVTLVFHLVFLSGTLLGTVTRWDATLRDERGVTWAEASRRMGVPVAMALAALAVLALVAPWPAVLLAPGLLLAVPMAVASGLRPGVARQLLRSPEEDWSRLLRDPVAKAQEALRERRGGGSPEAPTLLPDAALAMPVQRLKRHRA